MRHAACLTLAVMLLPAATRGAAKSQALSVEQARKEHWAFQPIRSPRPPAVKSAKRVRNEIDRFILRKLEAKRIAPSPPADRRTLIRRVTVNLTGVLPTPEEVRAFLANTSPGAWAKLVDRLLASPLYGQRWGRHWLDVARYADTKGYVGDNADNRYPFAFTYRDYVIDAFNADKPFDRFVTEQIAADRLGLKENDPSLAALGFLTVGRRFTNKLHEIIDDRIDVITRGLMGVSVTCARCHDHKYDPFSMADYYGLYGVLRSSDEPESLPVIGTPEPTPAYKKYKTEMDKRQRAMADYRKGRVPVITEELRARVGDYLEYIAKTLPKHKVGAPPKSGRRGAFRRGSIEDWRKHLDKAARENNPVFVPWHRLAKLERKSFAESAKRVIAPWEKAGDGKAANRIVLDALKKSPPKTMTDVASVYGRLLEDVHKKWKEAQKKKPAPKALPDPAAEELRQVLYKPGTPTALDYGRAQGKINQGETGQIRKRQRKINDWLVSGPGSPPRAMVLHDREQPVEPTIFQRGNHRSPGPRVPRRFLRVLSHVDGGKTFTDGSGRRELAAAIVHPDNPLTARVMVNRVWGWHFGAPLVATTSDFGARGARPTHPELLDHLASAFRKDGWSVKKLHRRILLSATYRQSSADRAGAAATDPRNALLWRMNRVRMDFETMRDALLAAAGRLDVRVRGRPVDLMKQPTTRRRTVYGNIDRQNLQRIFRTFDFASPDATSPGRPNTTVPQQSLFFMNSAFVIEQAKHLLERAGGADDGQRVRRLYEILYARAPTSRETAVAMAFVRAPVAAVTPPAAPRNPWQNGYGAFDPKAGRVRSFTHFPHWTGDIWRGGEKFPHPKTQWLFLSATKGHPGWDHAHAVIRRWTAPQAGVIRVHGRLTHPSDKGDGVRASVVSQRAGRIGQWVAQKGATDTLVARHEVKAGEVIDFVVDCRAHHHYDSFEWAPTIERIDGSTKPRTIATWDAAEQFGGHRTASQRESLSPWEQYAQALLLSNEFLFVD